MKVAFYIRNFYCLDNLNLENLYDGNPGIGGTEYVMFIIAHLLTTRDNNIDILVYLEKENILPKDLKYIIVPDIEIAAMDAAKKGCERFVFDCKWVNWEEQPFPTIPYSLRLIPWLHTPCKAEILHEICSHPNFGRLICVGNEQRDLYRDDWTFAYTDYIFNCVPQQNLPSQNNIIPYEDRKNIVTYIGSLTPRKTFHVLAEIWPIILKQVPDAELYVIGSASLYDDIDEYGPYHIAEKTYENSFMPFLTKGGKIVDSVHFMGVMGKGKEEILKATKVGVPNPTGKTETFCLSAVEMQLMGCSVTAMQAPGYFDTIFNGKVTKRNKHHLANSIVSLLKAKRALKTYKETISYFQENFSENAVSEKWECLLLSDLKGQIVPIIPVRNLGFRLKWFKVIMCFLKKICPILNKFYPIEKFVIKYEKTLDTSYRFY